MLDLLELALTWDELDYTTQSLIEPYQWDDFLASHQWGDEARAARVFRLAGDLALREHRPVLLLPAETATSADAALTGQPCAALAMPMTRVRGAGGSVGH